MKTILIAAELWDVFAEANSCQQAAEQKANRPVSVRTFDYGGFLYAAFSTIWGPYGENKKPIIDAYQLWPNDLYSGETTLVYHDEEAIASGQRQRGDSTGLIVSAKGRLMVCAEKQRFLKGLPGTRPYRPPRQKLLRKNPVSAVGVRSGIRGNSPNGARCPAIRSPCIAIT